MDGPEQQKSYLYCNVYEASACFGVAGGDVMTMRVPMDFVTYDLELVGGAKVLIYSGYNPSRVPAPDTVSTVKIYSVPSGDYEYVMAADGKHVITYTPRDNEAPLLQIVVDQIGASKKRLVADFLSRFRPCKSDADGVACDKDQVLFKGVAEEVFGL
ncbi:hypothetical protein [Stenotrophomonas bentonitica]|uniref:hypothetical protein n=1 Tax=Stenotrophomonas bentonitica TaxID=1450134 RepID=UPI00345ED5E9